MSRHPPHRERPPMPEGAHAQNLLDDGVFARCQEYVRAHARGPVEGLFGPGSVSWAMYREPVTVLGGLSAVLLQMAHPAIAAGVAQHSTFAEDVAGRAMRTSSALYDLVFGPLDAATAVSRRLHGMHRRVWGRVDEGPERGHVYRANDQSLMRWVAATMTMCGEAAFELFVRPLTDDERERGMREMLVANAAVGVAPESLPEARADFEAWYREELRSPALTVGSAARRVVETLSHAPVIYGPFDAMLAAGFLPPAWREAYGFRWGRAERRRFEAMAAGVRAATRLTPAPYRYVVAWHQAQARLQRAGGREPSPWSRALDAVGARWDVPTALTRPRARAA